ncbi:phage tail sheath C-terminal domain-containing protein [Caballeronia sp. ATUFL_M2_KS44]|uniref:phage tail sheath family protein n=1 Tax=Caballeronia sp. ATUFL_M2_KS44 TaxID=2921767 RepID=UPI0020296B4B|nr:phage tail sheath C-terminal domain-containing protein [Caballeronia sp. ATUFL_M2_KS44]
MATSYLAPGLYVEERSTGARPIEAVGTSTAAFLGEPPDPGAHSGVAHAVNSWTEFQRTFVGKASASTLLSHAVFGFFLNGGRRCYVVNTRECGLIKGLQSLERVDDVNIVAAPGMTDIQTYEAVLSHCEAANNRFAILDAPRDVEDIGTLTRAGMLTETGKPGAPAQPAAGAAQDGEQGADEGAGVGARDSNNGAFYFPWFRTRDALASGANDIVTVPPSGHMAGVYARTDALRGVHKAPANERVNGALGLTYLVTDSEQAVLNPAGVNCIRMFQGGVRVWGARTTARTDIEWRYINVRRLFMMICQSIRAGTRWVVFEPNDRPLWQQITGQITAFLLTIWRDGALAGATQEEAFFVKCDAEVNPPEEIDNGRVIVVIGIAPVKPAEFVIFRIGQGVGSTDLETV